MSCSIKTTKSKVSFQSNIQNDALSEVCVLNNGVLFFKHAQYQHFFDSKTLQQKFYLSGYTSQLIDSYKRKFVQDKNGILYSLYSGYLYSYDVSGTSIVTTNTVSVTTVYFMVYHPIDNLIYLFTSTQTYYTYNPSTKALSDQKTMFSMSSLGKSPTNAIDASNLYLSDVKYVDGFIFLIYAKSYNANQKITDHANLVIRWDPSTNGITKYWDFITSQINNNITADGFGDITIVKNNDGSYCLYDYTKCFNIVGFKMVENGKAQQLWKYNIKDTNYGRFFYADLTYGHVQRSQVVGDYYILYPINISTGETIGWKYDSSFTNYDKLAYSRAGYLINRMTGNIDGTYSIPSLQPIQILYCDGNVIYAVNRYSSELMKYELIF